MGVILRRSDLSTPGPIGSTTASSGAFTTLSASSTVSGNGFTNLFAAPPAIGSTTPGTGVFTTLQLNTGGPLFRNNAGTIEARDATNSAAAPFNCGNINSTGTITVGSFGLDHVISGSVTVDRQNTNQLVLRNTAFNTGVRGSLLFSAIDGLSGTTRGAASIQMNVQSATLNTNISAGLEFVTTEAQAFASSTQARLRIWASGGVSIAQNSAAQVDPGTSNLRVVGNASVGSLTVNGGLYVRQQAVPSSPVTGQRWDEVDGSGLHIYSWYYDGTDWVGVPLIPTGMPPTIQIAAATTPQLFVFPIPSFASRVLLVPPFVFGYKIGATNDGSNNLTMEFRRGTTANVTMNSNGTALSGHQAFSTVFTKSTSAESPNSNSTFSANLSEKMPSGFNALGISVTGVGSPSLLNPAGLVYGNFRLIR